MHVLGEKPNSFDIKTYGDTFMNWAEDVDNDGRQDLIVVDFPGKPTWWFQNPGHASRKRAVEKTRHRPRHQQRKPAVPRRRRRRPPRADLWRRLQAPRPRPPAVQSARRMESHADLRPRRREHGRTSITASASATSTRTAATTSSSPTAGGKRRPNHDRPTPGPSTPPPSASRRPRCTSTTSTATATTTSSAPPPTAAASGGTSRDGKDWKTHLIDESIAQTHALILADMNGDGLPDLVTGKRYYAHNGRDPGEDEPPEIAWFELIAQRRQHAQVDQTPLRRRQRRRHAVRSPRHERRRPPRHHRRQQARRVLLRAGAGVRKESACPVSAMKLRAGRRQAEQFRRRRLPHWDRPRTYFVTACLAGSIQLKGYSYQQYRDQLVANRPVKCSPQEWSKSSGRRPSWSGRSGWMASPQRVTWSSPSWPRVWSTRSASSMGSDMS